jgi:hypothetical protein
MAVALISAFVYKLSDMYPADRADSLFASVIIVVVVCVVEAIAP